MEIGYLTDPVKEYVDGVRAAATLPELRAHIEKHRLIAADAFYVAEHMSEADFIEFRKDLPMVKHRSPKGLEPWLMKYGSLITPIVMLEVSLIAERFKAPWGCSYIRAREEGLITVINGLAYMKLRPSARRAG